MRCVGRSRRSNCEKHASQHSTAESTTTKYRAESYLRGFHVDHRAEPRHRREIVRARLVVRRVPKIRRQIPAADFSAEVRRWNINYRNLINPPDLPSASSVWGRANVGPARMLSIWFGAYRKRLHQNVIVDRSGSGSTQRANGPGKSRLSVGPSRSS